MIKKNEEIEKGNIVLDPFSNANVVDTIVEQNNNLHMFYIVQFICLLNKNIFFYHWILLSENIQLNLLHLNTVFVFSHKKNILPPLLRHILN